MSQLYAACRKLFSRQNHYPEMETAVESSRRLESWSTSGYEYEVFLSFRGPDTRTGFADYLYYSLVDAGVRVFRDSEELRKGEEIGSKLQLALEQSKISIPIFSKNYASSKWCLEELAFMVKSMNSGSQMILPIFYDVEPSDVRYQTGSYASAFRRHWWYYDCKTVQEWRDACAVVATLAGWKLQNVANGHEGKLVKLVVAKVLRELKTAHLRVVDTLVGIEDDVDAIIRMLDVGAEDVKIVGISGMGGIGKTTLAKVVYNRILDHFQYYAFLEDIRETSSKNSLKDLQSILLANVARQERQEFASTDQGSNELSCRLRNKKVLILLDDADNIRQINALVGSLDWFGPGSRIIVTTRNIDILKVDQKLLNYEVKPLSQDHAFRLFCKHAFVDNFPTQDVRALCIDIVRTTGGLPLALEVVGSFLCGKKKALWKDTLLKLKRIPDKEVHDKLKISYDALDYDQKQIFLDIACFFMGMDVRIVTYFWEDCQFYPKDGIRVLLLRSLIRIGEDNKIWMHDQLRDLGRVIIREENYKEPGRRSRLWDGREAYSVLDKFQGTPNVEGISLLGMEGCSFSDIMFAHLSNLRFLQLVDAKLLGDFKTFLPNLRWLSWRISLLDCTPANLQLENLVILDLSCSAVTEDWIGWNSMQVGVKLKVLDLSSCNELTKTPSFSKFPNLERLSFEGCSRLAVVDPSIKCLKELSSLNLKHCVMLRELPDELNCLEKLTQLLLDGTRIRRVIISEGMKELETISAIGCVNLTEIPISIVHLTSLSNLILDSSGLHQLPDSLGSLVKLRRLSLNNCPLRELPECIGQLTSLVELSLSGTKVATLPDSIGNLECLKVLRIDSSDINFLPTSLGRLTKLEVLNASGCHHLEGDVPAQIGRLSNLKLLRFDSTKIDSIPIAISELSLLQSLNLTECHRLQALPMLPLGLTSVQVTCKSVVPIPNVTDLVSLRQLVYVECPELVELPRDIANLSKLEKLELSGTNIITLPDEIGDLSELRILQVDKCAKLKSLPALPLSLSKLTIKCGSLVQRLPDLSKLRNLTRLHLEKCFLLEGIPGLEDLVSLTCLIVTFCPRITRLDGLASLECLTYLDVSDNENLEELPVVSKLNKLSILKTRGCAKLVEIRGLDSLHVLKHLDITNCSSIGKLPDLSSLKLLISFSAIGCESVEQLLGIDKLDSLSSLHLSGCVKLKCLPDLSKLKKLRQLSIADCDNIAGTEVVSSYLRPLEHVTINSGLDMLAKQANLKFPPRGTTTVSNFGNLVAACNNKVEQVASVNLPSSSSKVFSGECCSDSAHYRTSDHFTLAKLGWGLTAIYRCNDKTSLQDRVVFFPKHRPSSMEREGVATPYVSPSLKSLTNWVVSRS